jgi:hypothetical protein
MTDSTWGDLTAEQVGAPITLQFPWSTDPVTYELVAVTDEVGTWYDAEGEQQPANVLVLDVPEWGGPNAFQLPNSLAVTVGELAEQPTPEPGPEPEPDPEQETTTA